MQSRIFTLSSIAAGCFLAFSAQSTLAAEDCGRIVVHAYSQSCLPVAPGLNICVPIAVMGPPAACRTASSPPLKAIPAGCPFPQLAQGFLPNMPFPQGLSYNPPKFQWSQFQLTPEQLAQCQTPQYAPGQGQIPPQLAAQLASQFPGQFPGLLPGQQPAQWPAGFPVMPTPAAGQEPSVPPASPAPATAPIGSPVDVTTEQAGLAAREEDLAGDKGPAEAQTPAEAEAQTTTALADTTAADATSAAATATDSPVAGTTVTTDSQEAAPETAAQASPAEAAQAAAEASPGQAPSQVQAAQAETVEPPVAADTQTPAEPVASEPDTGADHVPMAGITDMKAYFAFDSAELNSVGRYALEEWLAKAPVGMPVLIRGHADRLGREAYNMELSVRRAMAARDFLISKGKDPRDIRILGVGISEPVKTCKGKNNPATRECLAPNRRVEIIPE